LKFENRNQTSDQKIGPAQNVIAKLKFHHRNGATHRNIDYGVWLNSDSNSTAIGIGDTRELVLLCIMEGNLRTFEDKRTYNRDFYSEAYTYLTDEDAEGYERVDITLIDQSTQASVTIKLSVRREGGSFYTSEL
jgi:hypothetical protein